MSPRRTDDQRQVVRGVRARHAHIQQTIVNYFGTDPPLVPPFSQRTARRPSKRGSVLKTLRASESQAPLVGRNQMIRQALAWLREPPADATQPDHRVLLIHGPAGAGKTRLAGEIVARAARKGWVAGFLSNAHAGAGHWPRLAYPDKPLVVAIDYAETRRADLRELFAETVSEAAGDAPLRAILIVREGKAGNETWYERLAGIYDLGARAEDLLDEEAIEEMSLEASLPEVADRHTLWSWAVGRSTAPPGYLTHPLFERPLFVLLDAHDAAVSGRPADASQAQAPTAEHLLDGVLRHEHTYWELARRQAQLELDDRSMNEVAVAATLMGGIARPLFDQALTGLAWLSGDPHRARRIADWWSTVYASADGTVRGVEPDMVGERLVVRAIAEPASARDPLGGTLPLAAVTAFVSAAPLVGRQRVLRVLTRMANDSQSLTRDEARRILAELLDRHLADFLPATFSQSDALDEASVGESLATTVASAALACGDLRIVTPRSTEPDAPLGGARDRPAYEAALRIVVRQVERVAQREFEAGRRSPEELASILAWAAQIDLETGRVDAARQQIAAIEALEPRPYRRLAEMHALLGRHHLARRKLPEADASFQAALREASALGDEGETLRSLVQHDRGRTAAERGDAVEAVALLRAALASKRKARGPVHPDTLTTWLTLAAEQAVLDADAALAEVEQMKAALVEEDADASLLARVRPTPARILYHGGARLAEAGRGADARKLWTRALAEHARDPVDANATFPYIVEHSLGDLALDQGDVGGAVARYQAALDGKRRVREGTHPDTVTTLLALGRALARHERGAGLDEALDVLAAGRAELAEDDLEQRERIDRLRIELLASGRRLKEAKALDDELQHATLAYDLRRLIFGVIADPTLPPPSGRAATIEMGMLANRVFPVGDGRLAALASRLADLYERRMTQTMTASVEQSRLTPLLRAVESASESGSGADAARAFSVLESDLPLYTALVRATHERVRVELERALDDPLIASIGESIGAAAGGSLADDRLLRRWSVAEILSEQAAFDRAARLTRTMRTLSLLRTRSAAGEPRDVVERTQLILDAVRREHRELVAEIQAHDSLPPELIAQTIEMTDEAAAAALLVAAQEARSIGAPGESVKLLVEALELTRTAQARHGGIAIGLHVEFASLLADEAAGDGRARELLLAATASAFREALRLGATANTAAGALLTQAASYLAAVDPDTARAAMAATAAALAEAGADDSVVAIMRAWPNPPATGAPAG